MTQRTPVTSESHGNNVTDDLVSVVRSWLGPLDRTKGPTLTSGATTVTLSTAIALRFKGVMKDERHANTKKKKNFLMLQEESSMIIK